MFTVYLAGPMRHSSYKEAKNWRDEFINKYWVYLNNINAFSFYYETLFLSPLRGKGPLVCCPSPDDPAEDSDVLSRSKSIVRQDRNDLVRSDVVIANFLGAKQISIGTIAELSMAYERRTPVITIIEEGNPHNHAFVDEASTFMVSSLDEAVKTLKNILG